MDPPGPRLQRELQKEGIHVGAERAAYAFRAEIEYYLEHHVEGRDAPSLDDLRDRCAGVLRDALGEPLDLSTARTAMLAAIRFSAYPDAAPALRALRERGLRLVVASNWDCTLPQVLADAGLAALVDRVVTSAHVGFAKPDRRFFDAALEDCAPEQAVYVGDSPENDVRGPAAAGLRAVLVARGTQPAIDAQKVERLTELPPLLFGR